MLQQTNNKKDKIGRVIPFERDGEFFLRLGSQRLERNNLVDAISHYHRASECDPQNLDIQLAIAEVLTEMHRYEQSNQLLFPMLSEVDSPAECFFGIACNFLGMQEFSHAQDSLESYLAMDPEGEFVSDALDMLDIIEDTETLYSIPGVQPPDEREAYAACARGRSLLEFGQTEEAVTLFEEILKKWPEAAFVQNNMALAYFCNKQFEEAMVAVKTVLERNPQNVQAHCNLLLFLHAAKDENGVARELAFLRDVQTDDPQDWNRMSVVYLELGQTQDALAVLKRLELAVPYDEGTLHRLAICRYQQGQYLMARDYYDRLLKINPDDTVAAYYRRICHMAMQGEPVAIDWLYHYEVPYAEILRRVRQINEWSKLPHAELLQQWQGDKAFRALLRWGLHLPDLSAKRALLSMITGFHDEEAQRTLRFFQLNQMQPDAVKQDVFAMLKHLGAREPYIAYLGGHLVQSRVSMRSVNKGRLPVAYQRALELCMQCMQNNRKSATVMEAVDMFQAYINNAEHLPQLREPQVYALAAALEYLSCRKQGEEVTKQQIASAYSVSMLRLRNAIAKLQRVLEEP